MKLLDLVETPLSGESHLKGIDTLNDMTNSRCEMATNLVMISLFFVEALAR